MKYQSQGTPRMTTHGRPRMVTQGSPPTVTMMSATGAVHRCHRARASSAFLGSGQSLTTSAGVKTHVLRSGRGSRLSQAKESAEAAVTRLPDFVDVHAPRSSVSTASRRWCPPNISSVPPDHEDSSELPPSEGGGSPNQFAGHSRPLTTQAFPHGIAVSSVAARDHGGRTPGTRSDRAS
jgi:hypothetical protein